MGAAVFGHLVEEGGEDVVVLHEVEPSEAHGFLVPMLVDGAVDDGGHAAHHLAVAQGEEELAGAMFERGVLVGEEVALVEVQRGDVGRHILEEAVGECNKLAQVAAVLYFFYNNLGHSCCLIYFF